MAVLFGPGEDRALERLRGALAAARGGYRREYRVPCLWLEPEGRPGPPLPVDPAVFIGNALERILAGPPAAAVPGPGWTRRARVYNLFVRPALAWDHDGDGRIGAEPLPGGWRETGTLPKALALLPYIRSLGCDTVHLLPVAALGRDGRKGGLGSPYAVRDPYRIEPSLAEPALGLSAEECLAAFVAGAHRLGLRVVGEFVFRTASPDSVWAAERPAWFYWIDAALADRPAGSRDPAAYGPPILEPALLAEVVRLVEEQKRLGHLPAPGAAYRSLFKPPPERVIEEHGRWIGCPGRLRVATAFADWPPQDPQPPWTDAAYLRLYDHPEFNYVAYNTVRMYDSRLARPENAVRELWERIAGILPAWQDRFRIDGVMVDMGHALPPELMGSIMARARALDPDFAFWEEKFAVEEASAAAGYEAVIGYSWYATSRKNELRGLLARCAAERLGLPFFATAETHNSPRAAARPGGLIHSRGSFPLLCALPGLLWIHGGMELGERTPVNTGLDFEPQEIARHPAERLPLFSLAAYDWTSDTGLVPWIRKCVSLRSRWEELILAPDPATCRLEPGGSESVVRFQRRGSGGGFTLAANLDYERPGCLEARPGEAAVPCLLTGRRLPQAGGRVELAPGEVLWLEG